MKIKKTYTPIIAVFSVAALLSLATSAGLMAFMGYSLALLACLKLMDLRAFAESFVKYDFLAKRLIVYAFVYPFIELVLGLGLLAGFYPHIVGLVAAVVGSIGGTSIIKAVYFDKLDLNCACVGGNSNVPLGAVSFLENFIMILMGAYLLFAP